ncbi:MAG: aminotransferase class I/II-fold pyridoxal phosphate-dependent enzyme [Acidobacteria bacterium]|nr:MAG: aminotransferase class I/II-fold pyridoxal phosphate-dependent enzyme [Acidobacteriota bacterium]
MQLPMNRRQWLKAGAVVAAGLAVQRDVSGVEWVISPSSERDQKFIRLHSNENPYGPSRRARRAMIAAFDEGCRYPSGHYEELKTLIAEKENVSPDHIILGAGSHEILHMAGVAYGLEGGEVLTAHPTYEGLEHYARMIGAYVHRVPLTEDFQIDLNAMDRRITQAVRLVFVCNPNNPTGRILPADRLREFCRAISRRTVVLVDEAYHDYVEAREYSSMIDLVREGYNVIVSRTFSKIHALAGLRVGYGLARPDIIARLNQFRTNHSVNILGLRAAMASYQDVPFQDFSRRKNAEARAYLYKVLGELGRRYIPSHTNFVFFHLGWDVTAFRQAMKEHGVLVGRPFPPYTNWCRLSLGTMEEMELFARAFRKVMGRKAAG